MKRFIFTACAGLMAAAVASPSFAADLPRSSYKAPIYVAPFNWSGFYVGINGGYGWGKSEWSNVFVTTDTFDIKGGVVGGTLGYNIQFGSFVAGLEGDLDWSNIKGTSFALVCGAFGCETKNTWLGTARVRLGYAFDRWLPYVTGGAAFGNVQATTVAGTDSKSTAGWTVGGGLEAALWGNLSWKAEYLYLELGKGQCNVACGSPAFPPDVAFKANLVRTGLNYRF